MNGRRSPPLLEGFGEGLARAVEVPLVQGRGARVEAARRGSAPGEHGQVQLRAVAVRYVTPTREAGGTFAGAANALGVEGLLRRLGC